MRSAAELTLFISIDIWHYFIKHKITILFLIAAWRFFGQPEETVQAFAQILEAVEERAIGLRILLISWLVVRSVDGVWTLLLRQ
jgi:hypothetical protein